MAHITEHAVDRYLERIDGRCTRAGARAHMLASAKVIDQAASFGAHVVRLGNGAKLILQGAAVVTVIERHRIASPCLVPLAGRA